MSTRFRIKSRLAAPATAPRARSGTTRLRTLPERAAFAALLLTAVVVPIALQFAREEQASAADGDHVWSKRFGDAGYQQVNSVVVDGTGNVLTTGYFQSTVNFGGGPLTSAGNQDVFVAKFDGAGNHLWSKRFGGAEDQLAYVAAVDGTGNVFLTGNFGGTIDFGGGTLTSAGGYDVFVAKLDVDGNHLWSKRFGDASPQPDQLSWSVAADATGNVVFTGEFDGTMDFGGGPLVSAGNFDVFVAKLDSAGNHLWSKRFGDAAFSQAPRSVALDGAGNVLLTGLFAGTVDLGGGPLTVGGVQTLYDVFVAKFDSAGNHLWSKRFGDAADSQRATSVATDGTGNVLVTGIFYGTIDFGGGVLTSAGVYDMFVAKFDTAGTHLWSKRFGDSSDQYTNHAAVDSTGNVLLTGSFFGTVDFGGGALTSAGVDDIFLAKLDSAGTHVWSKRFGDAEDFQWGNSVAADATGSVFLAGNFSGAADFGGGPLASAGYDIFLARFGGSAPTPTSTPTVTPVVGGATATPFLVGGTGSFADPLDPALAAGSGGSSQPVAGAVLGGGLLAGMAAVGSYWYVRRYRRGCS